MPKLYRIQARTPVRSAGRHTLTTAARAKSARRIVTNTAAQWRRNEASEESKGRDMPFSRQRTCVDCGATFTATNYNQNRCHDCQIVHNIGRDQGRMFPSRDDVKWINLYIDSNDWAINCPICYKHMSLCQCPDPGAKSFEPPAVATWQPWK